MCILNLSHILKTKTLKQNNKILCEICLEQPVNTFKNLTKHSESPKSVWRNIKKTTHPRELKRMKNNSIVDITVQLSQQLGM